MAEKNVNNYEFFFCICLHCLNLHHVFTNEKGELTILTTKHDYQFASYTTRKVCFLIMTTNYAAATNLLKHIFLPQIWG